MEQATQKPTLLQRINAVRAKVDYIQKDKSVSTGGGSYKAATHDAVIGQVRQHLISEGVLILQTLVRSVANPYEVMADMVRAKQYRYEATYDIRFVNVDDADDNFVVTVESHAMDNADKAPGKAMSYAKKYAILKVFDIETGEDEESRYQTEDLDLNAEVEAILASKTVDDLRAQFDSSLSLAEKAKDREAQKQIVAAKNARLRALKAGEAK